MQDQWFTFNMFDAQAWYARDFILGKINMPSSKEMQDDWNQWRAREETLSGDEANIRFQADYTQSLIDATDYVVPEGFIENAVQAFLEWEHNKHENIMTFRDKAHKSGLTGNRAPIHHTPWMNALDDSMECYLNQP